MRTIITCSGTLITEALADDESFEAETEQFKTPNSRYLISEDCTACSNVHLS
jgi:hypothetical protein